jgi:rsbT co-antagonist protein RsbR
MSTTPTSRLADVVNRHQDELLEEWVQAQQSSGSRRIDLITDVDLERDSRELLGLLQRALADGDSSGIDGPRWEPVRDFLSGLSRSRAEIGFSPSETAMFVFSLKQPLLARLSNELSDDAQGFIQIVWEMTALLDRLGLLTTEEYQKGRESVIARQQRDLIELSTPVVKLWDGVVAVPLIGTLDSERTQTVMESLLERIVETNSTMAIIDITGVPTVDTLVAQHLLKTVAAARLMGADCIISGIRPQIAQTIVHLGLDLQDVTTKSSLADAVVVALDRTGYQITRRRNGGLE